MPRPTAEILAEQDLGFVDAVRSAGFERESIRIEKAWIVVGGSVSLPSHGWKLHVGATPAIAVEVLRRCLPILQEAGCAFKCAASHRQLALMNGWSGGGQGGKFLTAYPSRPTEAVALGEALASATEGLRAPRADSDRQVAPGSIVGYRYGSFDGREMRLASGAVVPAMLGPDGSLYPDRRDRFAPPPWAVNPFPVTPEHGSPLYLGRFLRLRMVQRSPHSLVWQAADVTTGQLCAVKLGRSGGSPAPGEPDAADLKRREAEFLSALSIPAAPALVWHVEAPDGYVLATEWLDGETLSAIVQKGIATGKPLDDDMVLDIAVRLADALAPLHANGLVFGDLKPSNAIVQADGRVRLVDFEHCWHVDEPRGARGGTRGYVPPEYRASAEMDVYALGAILYLLATGADPSYAPDPEHLLSRPLALMCPERSPLVFGFIERCIAPSGIRPGSASEVMEIVAVEPKNDASTGYVVVPHAQASGGSTVRFATEGQFRRGGAGRPNDPLRLAGELAETLARGLQAGERSCHPAGGPMSFDLNAGLAGTVLALADLHREFPAVGAALREGAGLLTRTPVDPVGLGAGLYGGLTGVGLALLATGRMLADSSLVSAGTQRLRACSESPGESPDLFAGIAGIVRALLLPEQRGTPTWACGRAVELGDRLLSMIVDPGGVHWLSPTGLYEIEWQPLIGYAHGAAGIADVLLDLFEATGASRFAEAAVAAGRWVADQAIDAGEGLVWPVVPGGKPTASFWCHGGAGIAAFLARASRLEPEFAAFARRAATTVARTTRGASPVQCHGLAGNIECLLDVAHSLRDEQALRDAGTFGEILACWRQVGELGAVYVSDTPDVISPDYMVGYAGVAASFLRLSRPGSPGLLRIDGRVWEP